MPEFERLALVVSDTDKARAAEAQFRELFQWAPLDDADAVVVLGGDGFLLQTLHTMLDRHRILPPTSFSP